MKIFLQFSLYRPEIALSERTITKDCVHHFLIATSKLPQDQIQAANSQKLYSPDTEREREKIEERVRDREGKEKKVSRHDKRRRVSPWRPIVSADLKGHLMLSKDHLQSQTHAFYTLLNSWSQAPVNKNFHNLQIQHSGYSVPFLLV